MSATADRLAAVWRIVDKGGALGIAVLVAGYLAWQDHVDRADVRRERRELLIQLTAAVEGNTAALRTLAADQRAVRDAIAATWPRVRLVRTEAAP